MLRCYVAIFSALEFDMFLIKNILHLLISFFLDTNVILFNNQSMWTGVATCTGLSAYFLKQAYLDLPETGTSEVMKHAQRQRRFLFVLAGASGVAGAYRFYLG